MLDKRSVGRFYLTMLLMTVAGGLAGSAVSYVVLMARIDALEAQLKTEMERNRERISLVENKFNMLSRRITDVRNDLARSTEDLRMEILNTRIEFALKLYNISGNVDAVSARVSSMTVRLESLEARLESLGGEVESLEERFAEIERELGFRNFQTYGELIEWLESDTTDRQTYIPGEYDCEDFAFTLMINAFKSRRIIGTVIVHVSYDQVLYVERPDGTYYRVPYAISASP